jgi:hypothetical protein
VSRCLLGRVHRDDSRTGPNHGSGPGVLVVEGAPQRHRDGPVHRAREACFDLAPVGPIFADYVAENALSDRLRFVTGDFFADALPKADVVLMGHVLHDWSLDQKRTLIRKAYEALPERGALVVYEAIIDDDRRQNVFGLLMSMNMLIETVGGFDYSGADCCGWMRDAGFRETRVENLVGPDSMVAGVK